MGFPWILLKPSFWSIRSKIMLTLIVVGLITMLAATSLLRQNVKADLQARLIENARSMAHSVALSCETTNATHNIKRMVFAVAAEPDVEKILIIDVSRNRLIAADRSTWIDQSVEEVFDRETRHQLREAVSQDGDRFHVDPSTNDVICITPCRIRTVETGTSVGAVVLTLSGKRITATTEAWTNRLARSLAAIFLVLLIAVAGAVETLVLRPIRFLKQASLMRWRPVEDHPAPYGDELASFGETLRRAETGIVHAVRDLQRLRWAVDQAAVVIVTDRHGCIESVNDQFQRFSGWDTTAFQNQMLPLVTPALLAHVTQVTERGDSWRGELEFRTSQSSSAWLDTTVIPRFEVDGQVRELSWLGFDVTARRLAESEARRLRVSTDRIIETALDGVITIDRHGKVTEWNSQATAIFGYAPDETIGQVLATLIVPPELQEAHRMGLERYLRTGEVAVLGRRIEVEAIRRDGSRFPAELTVNVIQTSPEPSFAAFVRDITDRKANEQALILARDEARAASVAKSEFLANVSHELRTPLTSILGYAEILAADSDPAFSHNDRRVAADTIHRNGLHLLGLINDILDLSKIEAGKLAITVASCDLRQTLHEAVQSLLYRATEKGLVLQLQVDSNVPATFSTDALRLRQILNNLLGNAVKFTEQGKINIHAQVSLDANPEGNPQLLIDVEDTGIGMTAHQLSRLFRPFEQVDTSAGRRFGGTGLGLAISSRCARLLGGDLTVSSRLGEGSRFRLSLPLKNDTISSIVRSPQQDAPLSSRHALTSEGVLDSGIDSLNSTPHGSREVTAKTSEPMLAGRRILLVEDGPDNRRLVTFLLQKMGATVDVAVDGIEALERIGLAPENPVYMDQSLNYDLVVSDMQMPRMDGYTLASSLRRSGCPIPIVALTAHGMDGDRERCLNAGCDSYAVKPINRHALLEACLTALAPRVQS